MNPRSSRHDGFILQELSLSIVNYLCLTPNLLIQGFGFWNYYFYIIVIQLNQQRPLRTSQQRPLRTSADESSAILWR
jgi:hypothetical protein